SGTSASGVTAGIIQESPNSFRLVLTSGTEGAEGISLQNGSSSDTLAELGFNSTGTVIKNAITGGAQSDAFSSSSTAVETLLGSASQNLSGTVQINGKPVAIDLSDNLETIKDDLVAAGIAASIAPETSGTTTKYRLKIEGVTSWEDQNNVLQSLGVIEGRRDDQVGLTSGVANTVEGSGPITADTKLVDIYGYLNHAAGDKISISGNRHDGTAVAAEDFMIDATTTVGDLLGRIEDVFGNVSAGITSEGKIQILDNAGSGSQLSVALDTTLTGTDAGTLDFGSFGQVGTVRKFVLQQGTDASFSVDGLAMTSSSNSVTNAVPGLSLNLLGSDPNTTLTVNVDRDEAGLEQKVNGLLNAYNDVIGYINNQMSYNADAKTTGGPLFGDNVLKSIKIKLQTSMTAKVGTSSIKYMADLGVRIGSDNKLSLDSTTFKDALATNFDDVVKLFTDSGSSADGSFQFAYSGRASLSGTYTVSVSQIAGEGQSIAGLIDGLTATGEGNILSLSGSGSGADGLGIRYTGSTVPTSATFSFTRGIASLLESQAYRLGDSVDGAVILQQNALQANMDALDKKISAQETLIEQKMALLKTQFENMDSALTQLQSMQTFLSSLTTTTS
ncbi:MAG: flagellar filament capping protein FliD, partial [Syntrophobacteraceae bacterium]